MKNNSKKITGLILLLIMVFTAFSSSKAFASVLPLNNSDIDMTIHGRVLFDYRVHGGAEAQTIPLYQIVLDTYTDNNGRFSVTIRGNQAITAAEAF